jgi:hypothetical protein
MSGPIGSTPGTCRVGPAAAAVEALPLAAEPVQVRGAAGIAVRFVWWSLDVLRIDVERLPGLFERIGDVLQRRYWPPDWGYTSSRTSSTPSSTPSR